MSLLSEQQISANLGDQLRNAGCVTAEFLSDIVHATGRRLPSASQYAMTARIERLIDSQAWTDATLALIDLELPQWQVRRLAYDDGEWYCALSRQRELPDWLDQSIETRHADLALAILSAFVEAQRIASTPSRTSVPAAPQHANFAYEPYAATISREPAAFSDSRLLRGAAQCRSTGRRDIPFDAAGSGASFAESKRP
jgi:hypothetical protein